MLPPRRSLFEDSNNVALFLNAQFTSSLVQCFYVDLTSLYMVFFLLAVSVISCIHISLGWPRLLIRAEWNQPFYSVRFKHRRFISFCFVTM
jgi:hypothetical protein